MVINTLILSPIHVCNALLYNTAIHVQLRYHHQYALLIQLFMCNALLYNTAIHVQLRYHHQYALLIQLFMCYQEHIYSCAPGVTYLLTQILACLMWV